MDKVAYKTVDLFGNEVIRFSEKKKKAVDLFDNYNDFVDKFEVKKTTDDCYTPPDVFNVVLDYVQKHISLEGLEIIRPFFPNGDFESVDYTDNCIVIDNPPFSIISKICRYYIERDIKFFLFAPHMTLFSSDLKCTAIVVGADIIYENGATVKTSFLSNIFNDLRVLGSSELHHNLKKVNKTNKIPLPKYEYPNNILTVSKVQKMVEYGIDFKVKYSECSHCSQLDAQKPHKKTLFGSGFLISEKAAAEKAAAEKAAAEKAAAEKETRIIWELSKKELEIIKSLE
jgi:hypothetical protein